MTAAIASGAAATAAVIVAATALRRPVLPRHPPTGPWPDGDRRPRRAVGRNARWRWGAVGIAVVGVTAIAGPFLVVAGVGGAWGLVAMRRRRRRQTDMAAIDAAMPEATDLLVACLHAGRSPTQAIVELARLAPEPVRPGFAAVEQRLRRGHSLGDAVGELPNHCGRGALALTTAVTAAVRDGLPLAPVLDRLTDDANASRRRQGEASARRLPVRLSFPLVVCTLPSFVLLAIAPAILGAISSLRDSPL